MVSRLPNWLTLLSGSVENSLSGLPLAGDFDNVTTANNVTVCRGREKSVCQCYRFSPAITPIEQLLHLKPPHRSSSSHSCSSKRPVIAIIQLGVRDAVSLLACPWRRLNLWKTLRRHLTQAAVDYAPYPGEIFLLSTQKPEIFGYVLHLAINRFF